MIQAPRGFLLPRFVNVGRHLMAATVAPRLTSKNIEKPSGFRTFSAGASETGRKRRADIAWHERRLWSQTTERRKKIDIRKRLENTRAEIYFKIFEYTASFASSVEFFRPPTGSNYRRRYCAAHPLRPVLLHSSWRCQSSDRPAARMFLKRRLRRERRRGIVTYANT